MPIGQPSRQGPVALLYAGTVTSRGDYGQAHIHLGGLQNGCTPPGGGLVGGFAPHLPPPQMARLPPLPTRRERVAVPRTSFLSSTENPRLTLRRGHSPAGCRFTPAGTPASPRRHCPRP